MLVDANGVAGRIKSEVVEGNKVRISKKTGAVIADPYKSNKSETPQA